MIQSVGKPIGSPIKLVNTQRQCFSHAATSRQLREKYWIVLRQVLLSELNESSLAGLKICLSTQGILLRYFPMQPLIRNRNYSWFGPAALPSLQSASPAMLMPPHCHYRASVSGEKHSKKKERKPDASFPLAATTRPPSIRRKRTGSYPITPKSLIETCLFMASSFRRGAGH